MKFYFILVCVLGLSKIIACRLAATISNKYNKPTTIDGIVPVPLAGSVEHRLRLGVRVVPSISASLPCQNGKHPYYH